jgi:hypothetical protein
VNRPRNWIEFAKGIRAIFDHVAKKQPASKLYDVLATSVGPQGAVKDAYAVAIISPELLSEDDATAPERELARKWAYEATFDVSHPNGLDFDLDVKLSGRSLGTVTLTVKFATNSGKAVVSPIWKKTGAA